MSFQDSYRCNGYYTLPGVNRPINPRDPLGLWGVYAEEQESQRNAPSSKVEKEKKEKEATNRTCSYADVVMKKQQPQQQQPKNGEGKDKVSITSNVNYSKITPVTDVFINVDDAKVATNAKVDSRKRGYRESFPCHSEPDSLNSKEIFSHNKRVRYDLGTSKKRFPPRERQWMSLAALAKLDKDLVSEEKRAADERMISSFQNYCNARNKRKDILKIERKKRSHATSYADVLKAGKRTKEKQTLSENSDSEPFEF